MIGSLAIGGSQAFVMNLYRKIDRSRVQFDFIIDSPEGDYFVEEIKKLGGKVFCFPKFNGKNYPEIRKFWAHFFEEHKEYRVLHSHVRSYASLYIPIAKKYGLKTIIHSHSTSNGSGVSAVVKRLMQYPLRHQADYLMACSNEAGQWLYGKKACTQPNYIFVPNAVDVEAYRFSEETAQLYRAEFGLQDKFVVGHVGRFHEAKNHMFLLDVFAEVSKRRPDAMLLLVGDGELRPDIEAKIRQLQLEDRVILTGNRSDVPQLLWAMDVFVFPSAWEGLPVTVVEAQAAGLPCLISDRITKDVDISELVECLPVTDTAVWAEAILQRPPERMDVTQKIKLAGFDVSDAAAKLTEFYETIGEYGA